MSEKSREVMERVALEQRLQKLADRLKSINERFGKKEKYTKLFDLAEYLDSEEYIAYNAHGGQGLAKSSADDDYLNEVQRQRKNVGIGQTGSPTEEDLGVLMECIRISRGSGSVSLEPSQSNHTFRALKVLETGQVLYSESDSWYDDGTEYPGPYHYSIHTGEEAKGLLKVFADELRAEMAGIQFRLQ